ncbi:MAG TPA: NHL repeat-containing protein, partial [Chloroflexota bacterium]
HGNLWVADFDANRVVMYPRGSAEATLVFGQYGSFTTHGCDQTPPPGSRYPRAPNRYTLCQPVGVAIDRRGTLYVADSIDNRVLVYFHAAAKPRDAPADLVLGQPTFALTSGNDVPKGGSGAFRCEKPNPASRCTLNGPMQLGLDVRGDLLVPDLDNNRVLLWSASLLARLHAGACAHRCFIPASRVWGQYGSFSTTAPNNRAIPAAQASSCPAVSYFAPASACTLFAPAATVADPDGNLYIADTSNNRVLEYDGALSSGRQNASRVYGQGESFSSRAENLGGTGPSSLWHPIALALDPTRNLWVTDFYNMRVLEFSAAVGAGSTAASGVLGQAGSFTTRACGRTAQGLCGPYSVTFDIAGNAFVSDSFNNRVLEFARAS